MKKISNKTVKTLFVVMGIMIIYFILEIGIMLFKHDDLILMMTKRSEVLGSFARIFMSIIMEGFPFIMIGAFISSLIHLFVSEQFIKKFIPKNNLLGILIAGLVGVIFPVCECAIVPIARRLIKKGVPIHIAITFMITVPVVNPIVMFSTFYAFSNFKVALMRCILAYIGACIIGIIIFFIGDRNPLKENKKKYKKMVGSVKIKHSTHCGCSVCNEEIHNDDTRDELFHNAKRVISHTGEELMTIGKYFIVGAALSSLFQVIVAKSTLDTLGGNSVISIAIMIFIAFMLSLCSEADAFIAKAFSESFSSGSIMAFMIFGPMIDLKNTLMLSGYFKKGFIAKLIFIIFAVIFSMGCLINILGGMIL